MKSIFGNALLAVGGDLDGRLAWKCSRQLDGMVFVVVIRDEVKMSIDINRKGELIETLTAKGPLKHLTIPVRTACDEVRIHCGGVWALDCICMYTRTPEICLSIRRDTDTWNEVVKIIRQLVQHGGTKHADVLQELLLDGDLMLSVKGRGKGPQAHTTKM